MVQRIAIRCLKINNMLFLNFKNGSKMMLIVKIFI
jgi:hypothetical protein